jgi:Cu/Ag efflux pump CusA
VERALETLWETLPAGTLDHAVLFRQADSIAASVGNVQEALRDAAIIVAVVLLLFLLNVRTTFISLTALPVSLLITALVFHWMGLSVNTMTLGGLAITIGELVDDAVVGVENVLRRLREWRAKTAHDGQSARTAADTLATLKVVADATIEVRSAILYSTLISVLVFVPLFALPGIEGRLFVPLGIAYIVAILASTLVSITLTPLLCSWLLPRARLMDRGDEAQVRVDDARAAAYGITPAAVNDALATLLGGKEVTQIIEDNRRIGVVLRVDDADRTPEGLRALLIETPGGHVPLRLVADVEETDGPNQVSRDNGRRRIVVSANSDGTNLSNLIPEVRRTMAELPLPEGYFLSLEGQFQAQEQATRLIGLLSLVSLTLIFLVLYSRYRSTALSLMILANVPLALVGSVIALQLADQTLSVASLVGFVTLAGIATRNGILKIDRYLDLMTLEGRPFGPATVIEGSLDRLIPVLMTVLTAILALLPLLLSPEAPGKEILYPVAVVIFGGLISSTLLNTLLAPVMFLRWGQAPGRGATLARDRQGHRKPGPA